MKIYIAGKITGDPNYKVKFIRAQRLLEEQGHKVLNPALLPQGMKASDYMRICFAMIDTADMVVFLKNAAASNGAMLEYTYCKYIGKSIGRFKQEV